MIHLRNEDVHEQLTEDDALLATDVLLTDIKLWLKEYKYKRVIMVRMHTTRLQTIQKKMLQAPSGSFIYV